MSTALVTGGSQGVGRGVVEGLAEAGMSVYFTARDRSRLAAVAEAAARLGGELYPRRVDHGKDASVETLFEEIGEAGGLDLLVNCAWGGYEGMVESGRFTWADPYWDQPRWRWDAMMNIGVRSAFVASQLATRLMLGRGFGLIVNLSYWSAQKHIANTLYGMAKAATDKMTADMALELEGRGIQVISLYPGLVRTERVLEHAEHLDLSNSESPRFIGRVIAALWDQPEIARQYSGGVCVATAAASVLGVRDVDGSLPEPLSLADA